MRKTTQLSGFTLMELMVVMTIIGIVSLLVVPEMRGSFESARLRSSARKVVNAINLAAVRASTRNLPHRVHIDPVQGRLTLEAGNGGEGEGFAPVTDISGAVFQLNDTIRIQSRRIEPENLSSMPQAPLLPQEDEETAVDRDQLISFYPDGSADAAEIILMDRQGFQLVLKVNPITARVRVTEGKKL